MSSPERPAPAPLQAAMSAAVTVAVLAPFAVVLWDLALMRAGTPAWSPSWLTAATFAVSAWGIGTSIALVLLTLRSYVRGALAGARRAAAWRGGLDGAWLCALIVLAWSPAFLEGPVRRAAAFVLLPALGAVLGQILTPRLKLMLAAGASLGVVAMTSTLSPASDTMLRLTLQSVLLVSATACLGARALPRRVLVVSAITAVVVAVAAAAFLARVPGARSAFALESVHARNWTYLIERVADRDADLATNLFGGRDCDPQRSDVFPGAAEIPNNGRDDNCEGLDGVAAVAAPRSRAYGAAAGRDILILSLDSLRFDARNALPRTRAVLGPHAELTRAVSPTPKTVTSIASMVRGRPFRQLRFERVPGVRNQVPVSGPSLGEVLSAAGYRALSVPTHRYLNEQGRVLAGFQLLAPSETDLAARFVPAPSAIELVMNELARSSQPGCVFLHFMESHHPYRYGDQSGPDSIVGLRNAVGYLDVAIADLITRVTQTRGRAPVVAVLGDHGEEFEEHGGRFHASSVFAEQVRVAFLLSAPGVPGGSFDAPVSTAALPATLLELAGVPPRAAFTEPSMLPFLTRDAPAPVVAVSEVRAGFVMTGYTFDQYRLLSDPRRSAQYLFDSSVDPLEQRDLSTQRPDLLRELNARARAWDEQH